ncbi:MAG: ATP-binding cassette domain-containing protein, partial [Desulfovibrio sp.]|nr:ATP-binding cassette domain-containing protein [Desulfovibrio sp.]
MPASPLTSCTPLAELAHVGVSLGGHPVLSDVSFRLMPGEAWAVVGENGSGKTTFLRLLRGDIPPDRDDRGRRLYALDGPPQPSPIGLRHRFGLVTRADWDFWSGQAPAATVFDAVCAGFFDTRLLHQPPDESQRRRTAEVLDLTGLRSYADRRMAELSEGLLRAALVARALAPWPVLLALDEIFDGLDPDSRERVTRAIRAAMTSGAALVATAHRPEDIPPGVTRTVVLHQGRIAAQGPLAELDFFQSPAPETDPKPGPGGPPRPQLPGCPGPDAEIPPLFEIENADVYLDGRRILSGV